MKTQKELISSADAVELSHLPTDASLTVGVGENTLVVTPQCMTAIQAVNTIAALTEFTADLINAIKATCGTCEEQMADEGCPYEEVCGQGECPYATVTGPGVTLTDKARREMGIPLDAKLELFPDEGEGLVCAAEYEHDITDVPVDIRAVLAASGVCLGRLDEVIMGEKEVWHDR